MTIYFSNKGEIDLDVIRTMGVSVKDNANPIGYFGTGLKFAIATLLRTGHKVTLHQGVSNIEFSTKTKTIRGSEFQMVYMEDEQLAFTTDLGKNWVVWQAYRELHSNCLDEMGYIGRRPREGDDTIWAISGPEIEQCYEDRHKFFLPGEPAWVIDGLEVFHGESKYLYYRGVRVVDLPKPTRFTLNFTMPMMLTEDRTLASLHDANYKAACRLPKIPDPKFCTKIVDPDWDGYENTAFDFSDCYDPSEAMLDAIELVKNHPKLGKNTKMLLQMKRVKALTRDAVMLTQVEENTLEEAGAFLQKLNCGMKRTDFIVTESLGQNVEGMVENGQIYIARACIAKGVDWVASTLYEEFIHKTFGYADCTRGMQQFLFDKIFQLVKEIPDDRGPQVAPAPAVSGALDDIPF